MNPTSRSQTDRPTIIHAIGAYWVLATLTCACGSSDKPADAKRDAGSSGSAAETETGSGSGAEAGGTGGAGGAGANTTGGTNWAAAAGTDGTSNTGGSAGTGGAAPGGSGAGDPVSAGNEDCSGVFGEPNPVSYDAAEYPNSLASTGDELELFYVQGETSSTPRRIAVRTRDSANDALGAAFAPAELSGICAADTVDSLDLTEDGLRLYLACAPAGGIQPATLRVAERPDRASPFAVGAESWGMVGYSISISTDELTLYAVPPPLGNSVPAQYRRASTNDPFGSGESTGITGELRTPDVSHSGLELYGSAPHPDSNTTRLVVAVRQAVDDPFSEPSTAGLPYAEGYTQTSPAISADCRTLYFVEVSSLGSSMQWLIQSARR